MAIDKPNNSQVTDVTLHSLDKSVVNWFEHDFPKKVNGKNVPVLYATSERWARIQNDKGIRDEKGTLILPIISIRRIEPTHVKERFAPLHDETNITLTRRLSTSPISVNDKQEANLRNKIVDEKYVFTKDAPVYEIVQIPFPSFLNLSYDVILWTSYMSHSNLEQENIFKEFNAGRNYFKIDDYYFFGKLLTATDQSNLDEFSEKEKIIKYLFKLELQAYLIDKNDVKITRTSSNIRLSITEKSVTSF